MYKNTERNFEVRICHRNYSSDSFKIIYHELRISGLNFDSNDVFSFKINVIERNENHALVWCNMFL